MSERRLQRKLELESRLPAIDARGPDGGGAFSVRRSGLLTMSVLAALLLGFGLMWRAHQHAQFHQFTTPAPLPQQAVSPLPGGQEAAVITRVLLRHNTAPEFASATLLPGLGMQILQMTVNLPGRGNRPLLAGPPLDDFANNPALQPGTAPFHLTLPAALGTSAAPVEFLTGGGAHDVSNKVQADGGEVTGSFTVRDSAGKALGLDANLSITLTGHAVNLAARLHNDAGAAREFTFDWSPAFLAPNDSLSDILLSIPAAKGVRTGAGSPSEGALPNFAADPGVAVPNSNFDVTYSELQRKDIGDGPVVVLTEPASGLVLRFVLLTPTIRSVRVRADAAAHTLRLSFDTDDGKEHATVDAGQSAEWRVRMEVSGTDKKDDAPAGPR